MSVNRANFPRNLILDRRQLLKASGIVMGAGLIQTLPDLRALASSSIMLGDTKVHSISDGNLVLPVSMLAPEVPETELLDLLKANGLSTERNEPGCNLALVEAGENRILFDVGSGANFMPTAGKLLDNLDAAGFSPDDITHVVFTHAHPDHLWGLLDDFDEPVFANAEFRIGRAEWDFWTDPETIDKMPEERLAFLAGARRNLEALEEAIIFVEPGEEILPGIAAIDTSGHTPGHLSFEVRGGSESLIVTGDAISHPVISFAHSDWHSGSDQDPSLGATARASLLDRLASEKLQLLGYHLPGNGFGRAEKSDGGFRLVQ
ncbi:MAG: MBL fold metallo-hydrolase [Rhizobiaceae bacterium]